MKNGIKGAVSTFKLIVSSCSIYYSITTDNGCRVDGRGNMQLFSSSKIRVHCCHTTFPVCAYSQRREATSKHWKEENTNIFISRYSNTSLYIHKRHRGKSVAAPKPNLHLTLALRIYDSDFHIMCVISQSGRFSNCTNNDVFVNSIPLKKRWQAGTNERKVSEWDCDNSISISPSLSHEVSKKTLLKIKQLG